MREQWAEQFTARAREHWTPERVRELTSGKDLAVRPDEAPLLLRAMGLLHRDASMPPARVRKYRQINHMIGVLGPPLRELAETFDTVRIADAGCGRSYLTLLLAHYFARRLHHPVRIVGYDRNPDLIDESARRAELAGLDRAVRYEVASVDAVELTPDTHMLVALHACDTATDDAIALGVRAGCHFIAVAPCCQAELAAKWAALTEATDVAEMPFGPVWASPHLRRATAADVTDTMRLLLLAAAGYRTTAIEFVPSEHTPKNTLIRGVHRTDPVEEKWREYLALRDATGGSPIALEAALRPLFD